MKSLLYDPQKVKLTVWQHGLLIAYWLIGKRSLVQALVGDNIYKTFSYERYASLTSFPQICLIEPSEYLQHNSILKS